MGWAERQGLVSELPWRGLTLKAGTGSVRVRVLCKEAAQKKGSGVGGQGTVSDVRPRARCRLEMPRRTGIFVSLSDTQAPAQVPRKRTSPLRSPGASIPGSHGPAVPGARTPRGGGERGGGRSPGV